MASLRAFIAVPVPDNLHQLAVQTQQRLRSQWPSLRLTREHQFHLTLFFFADLPEEQVEIVKDSMLSISRRFAPFSLAFATLGAFPSRQRARTLWLGPAAGSTTPLDALHSKLMHTLRQKGVRLEQRRFSPHLTLARSRQPLALFEEDLQQWQPRETPCRVDRLLFFSSRLEAKGAHHQLLYSAPLTGSPAASPECSGGGRT